MIKTIKQKTHHFFQKSLTNLGRIGKALLFPIATLPIAAILLRVGSQLPTGTDFGDIIQPVIYTAGNVLFANLHIIFAIGIAFGLTKDNRGEAALAGFIGIMLVTLLLSSQGADLPNQIYQNLHFEPAPLAVPNAEGFHRIFTTTANDAYDSILANNVLNGVITGSIVALIYNKFNGTELPSLLGFFSGKRLIPVLTVLTIALFGIVYAVIFPWIGYGLYLMSEAMSDAIGNRYANAGIMGLYGFINRLLIPFGLHHIPNTLFWFTLPVFDTENHQIIVDATNKPISGDIYAFINGVPENNPAGTFQSGFFPIMMFGLPALAYVFYLNAENKEQKKRVLAIFGSSAAVSFLTGISEPIEFAFLFISPILYGVHAILTGFFGFITGLFGIQLGFGFSAGFLDYVLSIPKSLDLIAANKTGIDAIMANPGWIFAIGGVTFATYFLIANILVKKLNIATPGRGSNLLENQFNLTNNKNEAQFSNQAKIIVKALGGWDNITNYQNCATRLRYDLKTTDLVNEQLLKRANIMGYVKVSKTHVQVIIGPKVELLNSEIIANIGGPTNIELKKNNLKKIKLEQEQKLKSICTGFVKPLSELNDGVFSKKVMGDGVVIDFGKDVKIGKIYSPFNGIVTHIFPTKHAYTLKNDVGLEILIHLGLNSADLKGQGFKSLVKKQQRVKSGQLIAEVDLTKLRKKLSVVSSIMLITSNHEIKKVEYQKIKAKQVILIAKAKSKEEHEISD